jgi:hypothetical protein
VKYLIEWEIEPKYRKEAVKAIESFKQPKELRTVFAAHNCVASNRGIAVVDVDNPEVIQKAMTPMLNFTDFKVTPITPVFPES